VFVTEVVTDSVQFLEPKNNGQANNVSKGQQTGTNNQRSSNDNPFANNNGPIDIKDDDLPFDLASIKEAC